MNALRLLMVFLSAPLAFVAHAQVSGNWGLPELMAELAKAPRTNARFTERKYMKALTAPLITSGTLTYEPPDRMVKRTLKPKPDALLVEKDSVTLDRAGRTRTLRMQEYPVMWAFLESIRSTLKGDLDTLQRFYEIKLTGTRRSWKLELEPHQPRMKQVIRWIEIEGSQGRIEAVEVQEASGDRTVMRIVEQAS
jgi:hypothetical protein